MMRPSGWKKEKKRDCPCQMIEMQMDSLGSRCTTSIRAHRGFCQGLLLHCKARQADRHPFTESNQDLAESPSYLQDGFSQDWHEYQH